MSRIWSFTRIVLVIISILIFSKCQSDKDYLVDGIAAVYVPGNSLVSMVATDVDGNIIAPITAEGHSMNAAIWVPADGSTFVVWNSADDSYLPAKASYADFTILFANWSSFKVDVVIIDGFNEITTYRDVQHTSSSSLGSNADQLLYEGLSNAAELIQTAVCIVLATGHAGYDLLPCDNDMLISAIGLTSSDESALESSHTVFGDYAAHNGDAAADFVVSEFGLANDAIDNDQAYLTLSEGIVAAPEGDIHIVIAWRDTSDNDLYVTEPSGAILSWNGLTSPTGGSFLGDSKKYGPEVVYWPTGTADDGDYKIVFYIQGTSTDPSYLLYVKNFNYKKVYSSSGVIGQVEEILTFTAQQALPKALFEQIVSQK